MAQIDYKKARMSYRIQIVKLGNYFQVLVGSTQSLILADFAQKSERKFQSLISVEDFVQLAIGWEDEIDGLETTSILKTKQKERLQYWVDNVLYGQMSRHDKELGFIMEI